MVFFFTNFQKSKEKKAKWIPAKHRDNDFTKNLFVWYVTFLAKNPNLNILTNN